MEVKGNKKKKAEALNRWFLPLSIVIICITTVSLYHKSVNNDFLDLDDTSIIVKNYSFLKDIANTPKAFTQGVFQVEGQKDTLASYYRPMMTLSFMLDAQLSPSPSEYPNPKTFLKANIFFHTIACILLLLLLLELELSSVPSLLLTLTFAVHPLLNQAVAWIPGRNDSLLTIFILLSLLSLLKYRTSKKPGLFFLHILFFVFALFTKENSIMFIPLVFILLKFVFKESFVTGNYKKLGIAYLICIIPWLIIRQHALALNSNSSSFSGILHTFLSNTPYFIQYTGKAILPFDLSVMSTAADTNYIVGLAAIALIAVSIFLSKEKNKGLVLLGIAWFFLFLIPSFLSGFTGLEHRAYLPLIGVIITASQFDIIKNTAIKPADIKHLRGFILLLAIFVLFYVLSASRLPIFHDRFSFDKSAMETSPKSPLPCLYLAQHYEEIGDYNNAIDAYREALKRDSTLETTHSNIAGDYIRMNNYPDAEKELRMELAKHPKNATAVFNLGLVVFQYDHKDSEGVTLWKKSISLDSGFAQPYKVLSQYYQAMGDSTNAVLYRNFYIKKNFKIIYPSMPVFPLRSPLKEVKNIRHYFCK